VIFAPIGAVSLFKNLWFNENTERGQKMKVLVVLALLFMPFEALASPIKIAGVMQEFSLRESIKDYKEIARLSEKTEMEKKDLRLLRSGSYDWFWKPKYFQKRIRGYEFYINSRGDTTALVMRF